MQPRGHVAPALRARPFAIGIAICVGAFALFAIAAFAQLFLLTEYRQWATPLNLGGPLEIERTRTLGYAFAGFMTAAFGYVPVWHNLAQIALLCASGWLLAAALRRLFPGAPWQLAVGAAAFFLFAEPMLDALTWQATILDKLAVFFTALGIYAASVIEVERDGLPAIGVANLVMLMIVFCACNSKEAAWSLVPSAAGLLALRYLDRAGGWSTAAAFVAVRKTAVRLAAPALYLAYHVAVVLAKEATYPAADRAHNVGGDPAVNVFAYVLYMLNAHPLAQALRATPQARLGVLTACALLVVAAGIAIVLRAPRRLARWWVWALLAFALATAIPARTVFSAAFYLLVPGFYLSVLLFVTVLALLRAFPSRRGTRVTIGVAAAALALHLAGFVQATPPYLHVRVMSANFVPVLGDVRAQLARTPKPSSVVFFWPQSEDKAYRFTQPVGDPALAEFLLPPGTSYADLRALNAVITDRSYAANAPPSPAPAAGTISVVLGEDLRLIRLVPPAR